MSGGHMKTPARGQAQPGQEGRLSNAAGIPDVTTKRDRMKSIALALLLWIAALTARWAA